jgi:hypothetical protein
METCPKCDSIFIQVNNISEECYCLVKSCGHRWRQSLIRNQIKNNYLRISMFEERIDI